MVRSLSKLLFTGVVPAICDAEAGQEDVPPAEYLLGDWMLGPSEFAPDGRAPDAHEHHRED